MLVELVVENYAVIERIRVRFHRGLNLLTGETGSGKSIVVDALGLLYGGRASAEVVRTGAERARVAGIFEAPEAAGFGSLCEKYGLEVEQGEILVEREVLAGGKSRAFVANRPVTAAVLRELAPWLGDIHGQHDQQALFSAESQLELLDQYAGVDAGRAEVAAAYQEWQRHSRELEELDRGEQETLRLKDLWSFQQREIEDAGLKPGEDLGLEAERRVLINVGKLEEHAQAAYEALYEAPASAIVLVRQARKRLEEISRIDSSQQALGAALEPAEIALSETAHQVRQYLSGLEADPRRLEQVESRLAAIEKLKRKYGPTVEAILEFLAEAKSKLAAVETASERRVELTRLRDAAAARFEEAARKLSGRRREAGRDMERGIEQEASALAMAGTVFRVEFTEGPWSATGIDRVRFLVSTNPGEEPRPLDRVASGGELSRLALALKTSIAGAVGSSLRPAGPERTLVFDEVDSGIGGRTAESVGRRLRRLAGSHQVLCVTHLPQIAGFADHHYRVEKREADGRTTTTIAEITGEARTREIGRMLSGERLTAEALRNAEQLIKSASR